MGDTGELGYSSELGSNEYPDPDEFAHVTQYPWMGKDYVQPATLYNNNELRSDALQADCSSDLKKVIILEFLLKIVELPLTPLIKFGE